MRFCSFLASLCKMLAYLPLFSYIITPHKGTLLLDLVFYSYILWGWNINRLPSCDLTYNHAHVVYRREKNNNCHIVWYKETQPNCTHTHPDWWFKDFKIAQVWDYYICYRKSPTKKPLNISKICNWMIMCISTIFFISLCSFQNFCDEHALLL